MSQPQPLVSQEYNFDPGAMVIVQMGEQLIGHPSTAIGELVKNGYDADATECYVYIHTDHDPDNTFLIIHDTGLGMDQSVLFGNWLRPSISSKRGPKDSDKKSQIFERNYLGSKGIGRLAAMALGRYVTVVTKTSGTQGYSWLKIDREAFKTEQGVSEVTFPGGSITDNPGQLFTTETPFSDKRPNPKLNPELIGFLEHPLFSQFSEGTLIVIEQVDESLRTVMDDERADSGLSIADTTFIKALRELVTPLELNSIVQNELLELDIIPEEVKIAREESSFTLFYGTNDFESEAGIFIEVEPVSILHNYDYRMIGMVSADSTVTGYYFCRRLGENPEIKERFMLANSYVLEEKAKDSARRRLEAIPDSLVDAQTGTFFFDLRVYDREMDALGKLGAALSLTKTKQIRETLDRYLGFRISKNGFGVKPYGEEQKDWLGINMLRVQDPAHTIGVNQILGNVFLYSPQNDGLSEKTNREGFFENKAFITFKKILRGVLTDLGQRRYNYRVRFNIGRKTPVVENGPDFDSFLEFIESKTEDPEIRDRSKKIVSDAANTVQNLQSSLTLSQRLASLGSGLELVYHELAQPLSVMGSSHLSLESGSQRLTDIELRDRFLEETSALKLSIDALDTLKKSMQPAIGKSTPKDFKPYETFLKICYLYRKDFERLKIKVEPAEEWSDYSICEHEYVFWVTFLNLINNAVYWLSKIEDERIISFSIIDDAIVIANSSAQILPDQLENIFEYGVSTKKEAGSPGTGLGLSFSRSMLATNGWSIKASNTQLGPTFSIQKLSKDE